MRSSHNGILRGTSSPLLVPAKRNSSTRSLVGSLLSYPAVSAPWLSHRGEPWRARGSVPNMLLLGVDMGRLRSLDGLRGLASLAVVFTHVMLTSELFAAAALRGENRLVAGSWGWLITYTPLHLFWDGTAAVAIFFVLSGLVLTLPVIRTQGLKFSWRVYYPKRLLRLYLPTWAAVIFGTGLALLIPRLAGVDLGSWLSSRPDPSPAGIMRDLVLISGASDVISPLWTLPGEVLFSLLLPVYIAFVVFFPRGWVAKVVVVLAAIGFGSVTGTESLVYMATFAVGCLLAKELPRINAAAASVRPSWWTVAGVITALLLSVRWFVLAMDGSAAALSAGRVLVVIGAASAVAMAAFCPPLTRILSSKPLAALGTISFSLYLVHEPIVLAMSFLFGTPYSWLAIPVSILVAAVFYRFVERPSHQLSIAVGKRIASRHESTGATVL